jgi:hypothetical protein
MGIRVRVKLLVEGREVETAALVNSGFERAARGRARGSRRRYAGERRAPVLEVEPRATA